MSFVPERMPSRIVPLNSSKTSVTVQNYGTKNGKLVLFARDRRVSLTNFTELRKVVRKESKDDMSLSNCFSLSITVGCSLEVTFDGYLQKNSK